jgi:hypothetical protein
MEIVSHSIAGSFMVEGIHIYISAVIWFELLGGGCDTTGFRRSNYIYFLHQRNQLRMQPFRVGIKENPMFSFKFI